MILFCSFSGKFFRVVWVGLRVARLQDNRGKNSLLRVTELAELIKENNNAGTFRLN